MNRKNINESENSIFEKILLGEIPSEFIYEDDSCFAINDINPQAPIHILIIPKIKITRVMESDITDIDVLGKLLYASKLISKKLQINTFDKGYRLVINNGKIGCETVPHLHIHMLSGRQMSWPPG